MRFSGAASGWRDLRRPIFLALAMGLAALVGFGQGPSFSTLKEQFQKDFAHSDPATRKKAVEILAEHGHPETLRFLLEVVKDQEAHLVQVRLGLAAASERREVLRAEQARVDGLVKQGKLGQGAAEKVKTEFKDAEEKFKRLSQEIAEDTEVGTVLRKSVGWVVARCSDADRPTAVRIVTTALRDCRSVDEKADLLRVMTWIDLPEIRALLAEQVAAPEPAVRIVALGALEERGGLQALRPALKVLHDPVWQVQAAAVRILNLVGGLEAARGLTDLLEKADGRLVGDAVAGLRQLTGQNFHDNVHLWREWLEKEGSKLPVPGEAQNAPPVPQPKASGPAGKPQRGTGFYGIETTSKHIVYVIDYSGSMSASLDSQADQGADMGPAKPGGLRKVDGAVTELLKSIDGLTKDCTFNVVLFASDLAVWSDKMQPATPPAKEAIKTWLLQRSPGNLTNLFGALERAFQFAGRGTFDKRYRLAADTIMLLSDGSPTTGRFLADADIFREIKALNELRRVAIHCVGLGRAVNADFLGRLARDNDGQFVHVTK